jgi:ketopantoate reductase
MRLLIVGAGALGGYCGWPRFAAYKSTKHADVRSTPASNKHTRKHKRTGAER